MNYTYEQMVELHSMYYDEQGFVRHRDLVPLKKIDGLKSKWSTLTEEEKEDNRFLFDILELDGADCIRFNITAYHGCGCSYKLMKRNDLENLHRFLGEYLSE